MENLHIVSELLSGLGKYPVPDKAEDGIIIRASGDEVVMSATADDLIELADLLVSLALSGENAGQHWHLDGYNLLSDESDREIVICRK
ncbi:MAG: hypothetical protein IKS19_04860 [Clostridia bacterium]|nr:hypothetical protein [Clostridia bacterium]